MKSRIGITAAFLVTSVAVMSPAPDAHAAGPHVVINELHYHPKKDNPAKEFVELRNAGDAAADISGWCLDGVSYCFPAATTIAAGAFRVVTATEYAGSLSNSGEHISLFDAGAVLVDDVDYDDAAEWPAKADGDGGSLERRDPFEPGDDPGNWMSSPAPTKGGANASAASGLLPVFRNVVHTVLPAAGAPVDVAADLDHASAATLFYRIGFGAEVALPMANAAGHVTATLPGQAEGVLVRYRLEATESGRIGTWPRQGDGARYTGTTVAKPASSPLPRFEWFIDNTTYAKAYKDLKLRGDDGYPCVIAYGGQIFDNTLARVKGQVSRNAKKKKWKFSLPAGHELAAPGLLPVPVDEFALHSSATDKSFIRETLSSELLTAAGVLGTQQIFPTRLEKNGEFYGLYSYVEQPDGSWRDRFGYRDDNAIIYEGGSKSPGVVMGLADASLSTARLHVRYDKETREWEDDSELRTLITKINRLKGTARHAWLADHVDIPQVINALAAVQLIQHHDFGHKNYRLVLGSSGRWQLIPSDFDLTFGRTYDGARNSSYGDTVAAGVYLPWAAGNRLASVVWNDPLFRPMFDRRVRTLTDQLLGPEPTESRVNELVAALATDAALDRIAWGTYKEPQPPAAAADEIVTAYLPFRRIRIVSFLVVRGMIPPAQSATPAVTISAVQPAPAGGAPEWIDIANPTNRAVDLSGWRIQGIDFEVPPGVVVPAGGHLRFVDDITDDTDASLGGAFVAAEYGGHLDDAYGNLRLISANGDPIDSFTYGSPPVPAPLVVVNEINAVADANLPGTAPDPFWGTVPTGNGKDWVELVVVSDHTDLRGWHVLVANAGNPAVDLVLPSDAGLADVRAGTILTISEELATDLTTNPVGGDWWMNVQLTGFDTSNTNTQVEIRNAANVVVFGPVGEGLNPASGVGSDEVARLDVSPSVATTATSTYVDSKVSSFGQPNAVTAGGTQDFSALRDPVVIGADVTPPSNVSGLAATGVTGRTAALTWTAATDDTGVLAYRVYVNGQLVGTPATASFGLADLPDSTRIAVEVVAVDGAGHRSTTPATLSILLPDATPPGPPRNVGVVRASTSIRVFWSYATDVSGIASFTVEMIGGPTKTTTGQSAKFIGLAPRTSYTLHVRAIDKAGHVGRPVVVVVTTK